MIPIRMEERVANYVKFTFAKGEIRIKTPSTLVIDMKELNKILSDISERVKNYPYTLRGRFSLKNYNLKSFKMILYVNSNPKKAVYIIKSESGKTKITFILTLNNVLVKLKQITGRIQE